MNIIKFTILYKSEVYLGYIQTETNYEPEATIVMVIHAYRGRKWGKKEKRKKHSPPPELEAVDVPCAAYRPRGLAPAFRAGRGRPRVAHCNQENISFNYTE